MTGLEVAAAALEVFSTTFRVPAPTPLGVPALESALAVLREAGLGKLVGIYERGLAHLPSFGRLIQQLSRCVDLAGQRRGLIAELNTAIRLQKISNNVLDISRDVILDGKKFTDLDVVTKNGSVVEVKDWATTVDLASVQDKFSRISALIRAGVKVDGVPLARSYLFAPGGVDARARKWLEANGVTVIESAAGLKQVV